MLKKCIDTFKYDLTTSRQQQMCVLMSESFIHSFIHSFNRFFQKRNTAVCCSETHNSSPVALIAFLDAKLSKNSQYFSLNFNLFFTEILLYKISVTLQSC